MSTNGTQRKKTKQSKTENKLEHGCLMTTIKCKVAKKDIKLLTVVF